MISRFGSDTSLIEIAAPAGAFAFVTAAVGAEVDVRDPRLFFAVTRTRSVLPTSTDFSAYVVEVAPEMLAQLPPDASHLVHWYAYVIGCSPLHVPRCAVSV